MPKLTIGGMAAAAEGTHEQQISELTNTRHALAKFVGQSDREMTEPFKGSPIAMNTLFASPTKISAISSSNPETLSRPCAK
jgi:hypothetical protein